MLHQNPHGPQCPWYDITEKTGAPNIKWCEETLCQWVSEPANTWSNIGYLIAGLAILYFGWKHKHNSNMKQFGPVVFFMGAMSFFYHQSNFYGSQILDFVGMFFMIGWANGMNLIRLNIMKPKNLLKFNLILGTSLTAAMHLMYVLDIRFQVIVLVSAFTILSTELLANKKVKTNPKWLIATLMSILAAFGFSISDNKRVWCDPSQHGWFSQGHAIWHWIAAISMYCLYLHYSQEALDPKKEVLKV